MIFQKEHYRFSIFYDKLNTHNNILLTNSNPCVEHKINTYDSIQTCAGK